MTVLPIVRTPRSDGDLIAIWTHIARDNESAASALLRKIDRKIELLAGNPRLGESVPTLGPNVRRVIVGNYLVFYQVLDDCIRVLRVYHAARKLEDLA